MSIEEQVAKELQEEVKEIIYNTTTYTEGHNNDAVAIAFLSSAYQMCQELPISDVLFLSLKSLIEFSSNKRVSQWHERN